MKLIIKGKEPIEWKEKRETPGRGKFKAIPELKQSLYKEQGGICAYCMKRLEDEITPIKDREIHVVGGSGYSQEIVKNKVEHIITQSESKRLGQLDNDFDYNNMLLCCNGKTVFKNETNLHCDTLRKNDELTLSPLKQDFISAIKYDNSGRIYTDITTWDIELSNILNLNCEVMKSNRKSILDAVRSKLIGYNRRRRKTENASFDKAKIEEELHNWNNRDENDLFKPYCGVVTWYLEKKLSQVK